MGSKRLVRALLGKPAKGYKTKSALIGNHFTVRGFGFFRWSLIRFVCVTGDGHGEPLTSIALLAYFYFLKVQA